MRDMTITLMLNFVFFVLVSGILILFKIRVNGENKFLRAVLDEEIQDIKKEAIEFQKTAQHQINITRGKVDKGYITAKIAEKTSVQSFNLANEAVLRVGALEKSTHKVHFIPADQALAKNGVAKDKIDKLFNPSGELFDWFEGMEDEDSKEAKD